MEPELLLNEIQRYTLHPIIYPQIWNMYKKQLASFWISTEIDFSRDKNDWDTKLNNNERYFLKHILAFFASSDGLVGINILDNFSKEVKILEAQITYNYQCTIEGIHSEVYSLMIDTYIDDVDEKHNLFNAISQISFIKEKATWILKWTNGNTHFVKRLLAFVIVEGLFFSGSFCAIFWIKQRGILSGLTKSNEFISRDEGMHTEFGCLLYSMIINKLDKNEVYGMFKEAVEIESKYITEALPVKLIGMNNDLMKQYIKYVADRLLLDLGYNKIYDVSNPFSFMNNIGLESRSNFFDERTSTYQKSNFQKELLISSDDF